MAYSLRGLTLAALLAFGTACLSPDGTLRTTGNDAGSNSSTLTAASGVRAARIIFKQANPSGSFSAPSAAGTVNTPGSGLQATRIFNADGSLLADSGPSDDSWPNWISSVEIGISGSNNTAATNADCARFAATNEENSLCDPNGDGTYDVKCGANASLFRVSEYDCVSSGSTIQDGNGGPSDGVYIRVVFDRNTSYLAAHENVMITLEYSAAFLNPAPSAPTSCFTNGIFDPTSTTCADFGWQIFLKHGTSEVVQPFFTLVPPSFASLDSANNRLGAGVSSKQLVIPLASDSTLDTVQISRIKGMSSGASGYTKCKDPASSAANSALCVGTVFYSMTLFRI